MIIIEYELKIFKIVRIYIKTQEGYLPKMYKQLRTNCLKHPQTSFDK